MGSQNRLNWFLSSLFFPISVVGSRVIFFINIAMSNLSYLKSHPYGFKSNWNNFKVVGVVRGGGNSFHNLMLEMNGPRVVWGRLPQLTLTLFIIFKQSNSIRYWWFSDIISSSSWFHDLLAIGGLSFGFVRASWMVAEQILLEKQARSVNWKQQGKNWTLSFNIYVTFCSETSSTDPHLFTVPGYLICPDCLLPEILRHPPLRSSHSGKHRLGKMPQSRERQLRHQRVEICSLYWLVKHRNNCECCPVSQLIVR